MQWSLMNQRQTRGMLDQGQKDQINMQPDLCMCVCVCVYIERDMQSRANEELVFIVKYVSFDVAHTSHKNVYIHAHLYVPFSHTLILLYSHI